MNSENKNITNGRPGHTLLAVLFVTAGVILDQWTKYWAVHRLKEADPMVLIDGVLEFRYLENRGAAFSMLQGQQGFFYVLTALFLVFALAVLLRIPMARRYLPMKLCVLGLCAGAIGNLIDRIAKKYVVDFIYFSLIDFPIFNVADIFVTCSVVLLILLILFYYREEEFQFLSFRKTAGEDERETSAEKKP